MGQTQHKRLKFPDNFTITPPSKEKCEGPGLLENMNCATIRIFPKCFEGVQMKIRKRFSKQLRAGPDIVFSAVTPSGGHLAGKYTDANAKAKFFLSPTGATALYGNLQLTSAVNVAIDAQLQPERSSVGSVIIQYSWSTITAALSLCAYTAPYKSKNLAEDIFSKTSITKYVIPSMNVQVVTNVGRSWTAGAQWNFGKGPKVAIRRTLKAGSVGFAADFENWQAYWNRRLSHRTEFGVTVAGDGREPTILTVGNCWEYTGTRVNLSLSSEGLVACALRKTLHYHDDDMLCILFASALFNHINGKFRLGLGFQVFG